MVLGLSTEELFEFAEQVGTELDDIIDQNARRELVNANKLIDLPNQCIGTIFYKELVNILGKNLFIQTDGKKLIDILDQVYAILENDLIGKTVMCAYFDGIKKAFVFDISGILIDKKKNLLILGKTNKFSKYPSMTEEFYQFGINGIVSIHFPNGVLIGKIYKNEHYQVVFQIHDFSTNCVHQKRSEDRIQLMDNEYALAIINENDYNNAKIVWTFFLDKKFGLVLDISKKGFSILTSESIFQKLFINNCFEKELKMQILLKTIKIDACCIFANSTVLQSGIVRLGFKFSKGNLVVDKLIDKYMSIVTK